MVSWTKRATRLSSGGRIAVIGGGPAGSFFALFALHYARHVGLDLQVTIFEPRDFSRKGPPGCNMCAGLIPMRVIRELANIGIEIPPRLILNRISHYALHTAAGQIFVPQPDPDGDVVSVYRGNGPGHCAAMSDQVSFDGFLLDAARAQGVEVISGAVTEVTLRPRPLVQTKRGSFPADLVVLAAGVNRRKVRFNDFPYRPPPRRKMAQTELCLEKETVGPTFGQSVHVFLPRDGSLEFGTLVPKGGCINASLLGNKLPLGSIDHFLALPSVKAVLPPFTKRACSCEPRISVGSGRLLYGERFVAVGDAGTTRLYKNGIGTALRTARRAAHTAVLHGVAESQFRTHYSPLCREITWDNRAGRFLFSFIHVFQHYRRLTLPHMRSIAAEQFLLPAKRLHSRLLWGMFTGTYAYRPLLAMACHPALQIRLARHLVQGLFGTPQDQRALTRM